MQQPWFQVFADLPGHRKIGKLRDALGLKNRYEAVGLVICIWSWAAVHAPSGELGDVSAQDLADAAGWRKSARKLLEALVEAGLIDRGAEGYTLHDWDDHQGMLQDALAKSRLNHAERQRRYRERKKQEREAARRRDSAPANCVSRDVMRDVTGDIRGDGCDAPTITITNTIPIYDTAVVVQDCTSVTPVTPDDGDGRERDVLKLVGGEVGQGILLLTDRQMDMLLDRLGLDGFNAYASRLVAWVRRTGANVDHCRQILKWWQEDTAAGQTAKGGAAWDPIGEM